MNNLYKRFLIILIVLMVPILVFVIGLIYLMMAQIIMSIFFSGA